MYSSNSVAGAVVATLAVTLLLTSAVGCDVSSSPEDPEVFAATIEYPGEHPEGPKEEEFSAPGEAAYGDGGLVLLAVSEDNEAIRIIVEDFSDHEGAFNLGSGPQYGEWARLPAQCDGPSETDHCRPTHTSRRNFGFLVVESLRDDFIAGRFNFRANDPDEPETAVNITDGEFRLDLQRRE